MSSSTSATSLADRKLIEARSAVEDAHESWVAVVHVAQTFAESETKKLMAARPATRFGRLAPAAELVRLTSRYTASRVRVGLEEEDARKEAELKRATDAFEAAKVVMDRFLGDKATAEAATSGLTATAQWLLQRTVPTTSSNLEQWLNDEHKAAEKRQQVAQKQAKKASTDECFAKKYKKNVTKEISKQKKVQLEDPHNKGFPVLDNKNAEMSEEAEKRRQKCSREAEDARKELEYASNYIQKFLQLQQIQTLSIDIERSSSSAFLQPVVDASPSSSTSTGSRLLHFRDPIALFCGAVLAFCIFFLWKFLRKLINGPPTNRGHGVNITTTEDEATSISSKNLPQEYQATSTSSKADV
ncbi:unnamed protein product [Amoebophrya sp. A25]|nr:unnamed protein product [Amoebophrya sp. A25]|eukprot:GSA25T00005554001.1